VTRATFAKYKQDTQTTLASYQQETQASLALYQQDTQASLATYQHDTQASLATYQHATQASLVTYYGDEDEEEEDSMLDEEGPVQKDTSIACSSAVRTCFNRVSQFHDDQSWQHKAPGNTTAPGMWQHVRPGCPVNCEICRFGGHL